MFSSIRHVLRMPVIIVIIIIVSYYDSTRNRRLNKALLLMIDLRVSKQKEQKDFIPWHPRTLPIENEANAYLSPETVSTESPHANFNPLASDSCHLEGSRRQHDQHGYQLRRKQTLA